MASDAGDHIYSHFFRANTDDYNISTEDQYRANQLTQDIEILLADLHDIASLYGERIVHDISVLNSRSETIRSILRKQGAIDRKLSKLLDEYQLLHARYDDQSTLWRLSALLRDIAAMGYQLLYSKVRKLYRLLHALQGYVPAHIEIRISDLRKLRDMARSNRDIAGKETRDHYMRMAPANGPAKAFRGKEQYAVLSARNALSRYQANTDSAGLHLHYSASAGPARLDQLASDCCNKGYPATDSVAIAKSDSIAASKARRNAQRNDLQSSLRHFGYKKPRGKRGKRKPRSV